MFVLDNVPLSGYSTMRLGGKAAHLLEITNRFEIDEAVAWADQRKLPVIMIGEGSNIIWRDEGFDGLVLVNKIKRFETFEEDKDNLYITVGAGENWDKAVEQTVDMGLSGLEELSLIPGTVGATPVQNVGAYGREVSEVITTIEAYDIRKRQLITLRGSECEFGYRTSRFKTTDRNRFLVTAVTFHLTRQMPQPPFYDAVARYFRENNITEFSPKTVRDAVIAIRSAKLPDPKVTPNNGSFFHNPIIARDELDGLLSFFPDIMYWDQGDNKVKLSAAWLLEKVGFKDFHDDETGMGTWPKQPLVFINERAKSTADLLKFRDKVAGKIHEEFGVDLQQEPELLP